MPRRNNNQPHVRYNPANLAHKKPKKAFGNKYDAEMAIKDIKKYRPHVTLYAYQSPIDRLWYLSSGLSKETDADTTSRTSN